MDKAKKETMLVAYQKTAAQVEAFDNALTMLRETRAEELKAGKGGALQAVADGTGNILFLADTMRHTEDVHGIEVNLDFIREQFKEIISGLENEDYALVADVIEFELMPMLCEWFDELDALFGDGE